MSLIRMMSKLRWPMRKRRDEDLQKNVLSRLTTAKLITVGGRTAGKTSCLGVRRRMENRREARGYFFYTLSDGVNGITFPYFNLTFCICWIGVLFA